MTDHAFFGRPSGLTLREIAALIGAELDGAHPEADSDVRISGVAPLDSAGPSDLSFFDNAKYAAQLAGTRAGVCLIGRKGATQLPQATYALRVRDPYRAFVAVAQALYPGAMRPASWFEAMGTAPGAIVHSTARLESGVTIEPGAVIGPRVEIGTGTVIGSGAVIGAGVKIGRDCSIGPTTAISNAYVGNRVIIHPGCKIGQDGFGYVSDARGHHKVPQIGRVIIQNEVEIGAGTMIDRGGIRDTVIGEGTKIDNLVQIGHNAMIGRHCIVVAQSGISGSATLKDGVVLGARAGVNNHVTVGEGAQIAGTSIVNGDVPANARWGGVPAKPVKQWFREIVALERLAAKAQNGEQSSGSGDRSAGKDEG